VRLAAFALLLLTAPTVFAQADESARQVLDDCIESIEHGSIGMAAVEAACPGLEAALVELGVAPFLPEEQRETLGLNGLISLQSLLDRYRETPETVAVEVDSLQSVLDSLQQPAQTEQPLTWFERFKRWLRNAMNRGESSSDPWLSRWLDEHRMSDTMRDVLFYGSVLLVVVLAIIVIANELRIVWKGRRKSARAPGSEQIAGAGGALASNLDIEAAARGDRPSLVFRMLVATLVKTGRLQTERSLTHRELILRAKFDDPQQRESFNRVADLAERIVYGGDVVSTDDLDYVVEAGRTLNAQLVGAAT
jgi:hypothetical protein